MSAVRRSLNRNAVETRVLSVLRWVGLAFFVGVSIFPFYCMIFLSMRDISEIIRNPTQIVIPLKDLTAVAYESVLKSADAGGEGFPRFLLNSALIALATVLVTVAVSIPGAYAVTRMEFFGKRPVHYLFLSVYLFPAIVIAIPLFVVFSRMELRGQLGVLVVVYVSQTLPVCVYMLRNYFKTIPRSLEEAAEVDGCTRLGVIRRITLPLSIPAVMSVSLYVFMIAWNEFLFALLFLVEERNNWTVSLGVSQLRTIETPATLLMAGSVILTLPIIILFFFAERLMTEGLTKGAEKG